VTIKNTGAQPIELLGWKLKDTVDKSQEFIFPAGTLSSGAEVRVYTDQIHPETGGYSFNRGSAIWSNCEPDTAGLYDPAGTLVSTLSYSPAPGC